MTRPMDPPARGLRPGASGPGRFWSHFDFPVYMFCGGFRWPRCQCRLHFWLAAQAELLCQGGSMLGVGRGRQGMIGLQSPAFQIFIPAQAMSAANVAAEGLTSMTAIQANHVVVTNRLAHRNGGGQHFFDRSLPSKLTKALVHGGDEVRKLTGPNCIMS